MPYLVNITIDDALVDRVSFHSQDVKMVQPVGIWSAINGIALIEQMGRLCYASKSEGKPEEFIKRLIARGHLSVLEHVSMSFQINCSRVTANQLVRHRIAAYSQMSQRYVNYDKTGTTPIVFCDPVPMMHDFGYEIYKSSCIQDFAKYVALIESGIEPDRARMVLPNGTMTTIGATMNLRQWRHVFQLRLDKGASMAIRHLMKRMWVMAMGVYPCVFEDITLPEDLIVGRNAC